jgi:hypothetical protein
MFERFQGENVTDLCRILALVETPGGAARADQLYRELMARDPGDWDLFNAQLVLRILGRKAEAVEASRKFLDRRDRFPPVRQEQFKRALEFCAGSRSAEDLIASMGGKRGDLCNAHLCVAVTALADGDRATARRHLNLCLGTRFYEFIPYEFARMLLARMDRDPAWPPWVKPAK